MSDIFDRLAGHWLREKTYEIAGMSGLERDTDFAVRFEPADAGAMPCARIHDHERAERRVDRYALRRHHPDKSVVHGTVETSSVAQEFDVVIQNMRRRLSGM